MRYHKLGCKLVYDCTSKECNTSRPGTCRGCVFFASRDVCDEGYVYAVSCERHLLWTNFAMNVSSMKIHPP